MKTLIFDYDWVINDSFDFFKNKISIFFDIDFSEDDFKNMHDWNIFNNSPEAISKIWWDWFSIYVHPDYIKLKINKDIKKILEELNKNFRLLIVTSWATNNICGNLKNNEIHNFFEEVLCYEFHKSKVYKFNYIIDKYDLSSDDCIFITDTLWDIFEANQVNIKTIAVDYWYHWTKRLKKWNPYKIISDLNELLDL